MIKSQFKHRLNANLLSQSTSACAPPRFFPARLMNPTEVQHATVDDLEVQEKTKGKWFLCGDVSLAMFAVLTAQVRDEVLSRVDSFNSPTGARYAVVSHQVNGLVHRFLLPLYEPRVTEFLLGMRSGEVGFLLGRDGDEEALLIGSPLSRDRFAQLLSPAYLLRQEQLRDVLNEFPEVVRTIQQPEQVRSLRPDEPVIDVSVSVVMPAQALMQFLRRDDEVTH